MRERVARECYFPTSHNHRFINLRRYSLVRIFSALRSLRPKLDDRVIILIGPARRRAPRTFHHFPGEIAVISRTYRRISFVKI